MMIIIEKNAVLVKRENVLCIYEIFASPLRGSPPSFENTQDTYKRVYSAHCRETKVCSRKE